MKAQGEERLRKSLRKGARRGFHSKIRGLSSRDPCGKARIDKGHHAETLQIRFLQACGIVGALALLVVFVGVTEQLREQEPASDNFSVGTLNQTSVSSALQLIDNKTDALPTEVLSSFEDEVLLLHNRMDVYGNAEVGTVGFTVDKSVSKAFEELAAELISNGWSTIKSGSATCGSFVKSGGLYRWAFLSCVEVGDVTSVVVQTVPLAEQQKRAGA